MVQEDIKERAWQREEAKAIPAIQLVESSPIPEPTLPPPAVEVVSRYGNSGESGFVIRKRLVWHDRIYQQVNGRDYRIW